MGSNPVYLLKSFLLNFKWLGNYRISTSLMLLMIFAFLAKCCLIFWNTTSLLLNFFSKKRLVIPFVAYKSLLIKHNDCMFVSGTMVYESQITKIWHRDKLQWHQIHNIKVEEWEKSICLHWLQNQSLLSQSSHQETHQIG